ncbi:DAK2 domain-containing protein [Rosenbergiella sp. S61]|uniref:DAK2 domain-containing protein n=1 Tax=Rosenbergiella gaditana TaxID=2726987 RepID=A0ABS5SY24_9GAMM|nr:DAK2 domain-containing protein [Rosenbergiella gaditana]
MSHFLFNKKATIVDQAIEGLIRTSPHQNLARLKTDDGLRIVVRRDWDKSKVAIISGGGSGHEPMHVGFVGKGMLTAAVCGDIFASPGVEAILHAIVTVSGKAGCLLVVKNYTGDRLNFGLAAEKARALGFKVEMVLVKDDISLPKNPQPRGLAGTILAHKVAGYYAEKGKSLKQIVDHTQKMLDKVATIGVALSACHLPGSDESEGIPTGKSELGMGIHGEHGVATLDTQNSSKIAKQLAKNLLKHLGEEDNLLLLINNLGGLSVLELTLAAQEVLHTPLADRVSYLQGPGTLVSALDMKGLSLTVLPLDDQLLTALEAPVTVAGWIPISPAQPMQWQEADSLPNIEVGKPSQNAQVADVVKRICQALIDNEDALNKLDGQVGDGDTGSTLATGANYVLKALKQKKLPLNEPQALLHWLGEKITTPMGGSGGVLLSLLFSAAAASHPDAKNLGASLLAGLKKTKDYGGADQGDRTMIDALQPAFEAMEAGKSWSEVSNAATSGAESTKKMEKAKAGRSSYLNAESLKGHMDPGACAVSKVFEQLKD